MAAARQSNPALPDSTPYDVVHTENKVRLRHYDPPERRQAVPVVFVYALINTPEILDLRADLSVVDQFLDRGFDVYIVEWGDPSQLDTGITLDDYVGRYLDNCVDAVCEQSGVETVHLVGFSTGSPMGAIYAALFPEKVASLGLQGPPLNFETDGGMLDYREADTSVDPRASVALLGNVPSEAVDAGFGLRMPFADWVQRPVRQPKALLNPAFLDRQTRIAAWSAGGPDLAGETYRQFIEKLARENALIENELTLFGRPVDLDNVEMPTVLILGANDEFVPHAASRPFLDAISATDTAVFEFPTGHVGTFVDEVAHKSWWPQVVEWFEQRS